MLVASALMTTFYFGGYQLFIPGIGEITSEMVNKGLMSSNLVHGCTEFLGLNIKTFSSILGAFFFHLIFLVKVVVFLWIFIWVRWTLPRFRYDQLMDLGWKTMLPWALGNTIVTAILILVVRANIGN